MMRLVISPSRRYHLGRQQQGFQTAITSASTTTSSTQLRINWTFSWSLDKQRRKRNNEHKLPSSLPSSSPSSSSSFTTNVPSTFAATESSSSNSSSSSKKTSIPAPSFHFLYHCNHLHNSLFSRSPLLPLHHILPSRRLATTSAATGTGTLIQSKSSASSHHSLKLARIGGGHGRFQGKMNILNRRLHSSSSPPWNTSVRSLFSFSTSTAAIGAPPFPPLTSTPNARFISTFPPGENSEFFHISPEVRHAVMENSPVVALESAIITHGMPFPDNIDTALELESIIRKHGVVPATVGVVNGRVTVGLSSNEIESLGESANRKGTACSTNNDLSVSTQQKNPVIKVSRRDLPFAIAHKLSGGTTVSGTIIAAVKAGIPIFATGGLGGVHRGAERTFDISADLKELGRNPIGVVSAGVKSILDIGKTLEYMETEGICVAVLQNESMSTKDSEKVEEKGDDSANKNRGNEGGKDKEVAATVHGQIGNAKFPSFFTSESQFTAPYSVRSEMEAASLIHAVFQFQLNSGVLIAVPIPKDEEAATGKVIEEAIKSALEAAKRSSVQGKDMTPFLLGEVNRLTGGLSLKANKHLIENNVRSACGIATHLAQLRGQQTEQQRSIPAHSVSRSSSDNGSSGANTSNSFSKGSSGASSSSVSGTGQRFSPGSEKNQLRNDSSCINASGRDDRDTGMLIETIGESTRNCYKASGKNNVEKHSNETTEEGLSTSPTYDKAHSRHNKPVVIGGTSLDLVLAIQENEIVALVVCMNEWYLYLDPFKDLIRESSSSKSCQTKQQWSEHFTLVFLFICFLYTCLSIT